MATNQKPNLKPKLKTKPTVRVELRRFVRMQTMVQTHNRIALIVGNVTVDYYHAYRVQSTHTVLTTRTRIGRGRHDTPGNAQRCYLDAITTDQVVPRPRPGALVYEFCATHETLFTPRQREVIELYWGMGYHTPQVAHALRIAPPAVSKTLRRIRTILRAYARAKLNRAKTSPTDAPAATELKTIRKASKVAGNRPFLTNKILQV